jgi:Domain of unknown function (DUF6321)
MNKPVKELENGLLKLSKTDYNTIDRLMKRIGKKYNVDMKTLHNDFVNKHDQSPDSWIKRKMGQDVKKTKSCGCSKTFKEFLEILDEKSPAWQTKAGKNPKGGLNKKGIESYRKEHPGSKLSLAVTTKPSKLKKGSKKWKRRKSFCSRMLGMRKKLTSSKTARDPNSRINKSLRKWNC